MTDQIKDYNFMGVRKIAAAFSIVLILISIGSLAFQGLKLGLDFTGGTLVEVSYENSANVGDIRRTLNDQGYQDVIVQHFGSEQDVLVRMSESYRANIGDEVLVALQESSSEKVELRRAEFVGAQVGEELRDEGGLALLF